MNYFITFLKFIFPLFSFKSVTDTAACISPVYFHSTLIIYCLMSSTEMKLHSKLPSPRKFFFLQSFTGFGKLQQILMFLLYRINLQRSKVTASTQQKRAQLYRCPLYLDYCKLQIKCLSLYYFYCELPMLLGFSF